MTRQDIGKLSILYMAQGIVLTIIVSVAVLLVERFTSLEGLDAPVIYGSVFAFVIVVAEGLTWRYVATQHPDSLPTFFTSVSGFRLLLALATMFVYYLVADGRDAMVTFFIVFMAYYVVMLIHHSIYFAKVSNRS